MAEAIFPASESEFKSLVEVGKTVPIVLDVLGDLETPVSAYWKLAHSALTSVLFESVTGGEHLARYSYIGVEPDSTLFAKDGAVEWGGLNIREPRKLDGDQDPLHELDRFLPKTPVQVEGLPKFIGGAVCILGYDLVRHFEHLSEAPKDDLNLPDLVGLVFKTVVVFDHAKNLIRLIHLCDPERETYAEAVERLLRIAATLDGPLPVLPEGTFPESRPASNFERKEFESAVERIREYIAAGDGIQMVPSQRFSVPVAAHPLTVYRSLRSLNPSPYMFLIRCGSFDVVGASPEILVSLDGRTARVRPIAGTRKRGKSEAEDKALETELLADEKERAEHIMLVDLGRNDLGKVCDYGTVTVGEFMVVERYSHVMHIVSDVTGRLRDGKDAFDLVRATFPAGTVTGAPKVRAMQIIDEVEPNRRGFYAGAIGYFGANGDADLAITIRTIVIQNGVAHVQAGAGVVYDSDPAKEFDETCNKAKAALTAIQRAQRGL